MQDALPTERLEEREALLQQLEVGGYLTDPRLEEAMLAVPRHVFLPDELVEHAYEDRPLPVGFGQTISAPHMVALMTGALQLQPGQTVLEVGTGVGYHAAVTKHMVGPEGRVISIEYLPELAEWSVDNLEAAGYDVDVILGDGAEGVPEEGPFDAIYITCAVPHIPPGLVAQLKDGGHFIAPVGVTRCQLMAGRRVEDTLDLEDLGPCLFVNAQGALGDRDPDDDDDDDDGDGGLLAPAP